MKKERKKDRKKERKKDLFDISKSMNREMQSGFCSLEVGKIHFFTNSHSLTMQSGGEGPA